MINILLKIRIRTKIRPAVFNGIRSKNAWHCSKTFSRHPRNGASCRTIRTGTARLHWYAITNGMPINALPTVCPALFAHRYACARTLWRRRFAGPLPGRRREFRQGIPYLYWRRVVCTQEVRQSAPGYDTLHQNNHDRPKRPEHNDFGTNW